MKPFNLKLALAGDTVITRDGRKIVQIFHVDKTTQNDHKVIAVDEKGEFLSFSERGRYYYDESVDTDHDLFMATKTVTHTRKVALFKDGSMGTVPPHYRDNDILYHYSNAIEIRTITWEVEL